ncbi:FAD-dependent oxidoreductase [Paenibacillus radicis (ex Gao et al. 2016)]|uniref:FAD-dependent oxidoreductase n=1 Tax=Paenibacillus radicis (ex Gao et al. 2016) TaxID=1737354 RepID=A0A917GYN1_9BACL|nr:FAD-dependent oxidoreductase [Paenibacillus radicis (ex Gao et al. 2016)]GGG61583.1 hypothetical protein GCM10010918_13890 [Paenibacillus radicis (ex Gao et al. 2016)]
MFNRLKGIKTARIIMVFVMLSIVFQLVAPSSLEPHLQAEPSCGKDCSYYDVIVIGSEIQGVLLAKEVRKARKSVLILDPRTQTGGELIQGQMQFLDIPNDRKNKSIVQGEIKYLFDAYKSGSIRKAHEFNQYFNQLVRGIPIEKGIKIQTIETVPLAKEKSLKSITYKTQDGATRNVQANYWVENTDFNALTSLLDLKRIPGMESLVSKKDPTPEYMSATLMIKFKNVDWSKLHKTILKDYPLTNVQKKYGPNTYVDWTIATGFGNLINQYKPTDPQLVLRGMNTLNQKNGRAIMNALLVFDVDPSKPESVKSAIAKASAEAPHILKFLRQNIPGFAKAELDGFPDYLYIRDYNRFETEHILQKEDLKSNKMFWDNVSIGGYGMDLQATKRIPTGIGFGLTDRYGMPLRSFELKAYENVIVAGKNVGASIQAYGSARIMPNTATAAQTIGIIIGRESGKKRLKELTPEDFKRIHKYLKKDFNIVLAG